ncbi:Flp family type IVb pilin [Prescottella equi]|uniref:Flp family type IVb pilin n=1 Tax=Rhodococcus hoagii TaxID=43767 RepID=UPI00119DF536|nr:Flp family type IVb pilin [Prescottella equi]
MNLFFANLYLMGLDAKDRLTREDRGATAVEYGLMVGLIAVVIIAAVILLGNNLNGLFGEVNTGIADAGAGGGGGGGQ